MRVVNDLLLECDTGKVSIISLLDLSAAFDTIDHDILLDRLYNTFGCDGIVLEWFKSYLSGRTQSVCVKDYQSSPSLLKYGVPQGSVLGPILFTMYTQQLGLVIKQSVAINYHFFADDSQMHDSAPPSEISRLSADIASCIENVATWMKCNKLKMNDDKTELALIGTKK